MLRVGRLLGTCLAALALLVVSAPAAISPATQPAGRAGCVNARGGEGCAAVARLAGLEPLQMAVSPNGRFVYVALQAELIPGPRQLHSRLLVFARDPRSGTLHELPGRRGCLEDTVRPVRRQRGPCERVGGIEQPFFMVLSPDGRHLYVSGGGGRDNGGDYLVTFAVDPRTGTLREVQCLTDQRHSHCTSAPLRSFGELLVSPDSRYVYAGDGGHAAMDVYRVTTRGLVLAQCLSAKPLPGTSCVSDPLLMEGGVEGLAISSDGSQLYAGGALDDDASRVVEFTRDAADGLLTPGSGTGDCVTDAASPPPGCSTVTLAGDRLVLSETGDTLYSIKSTPELGVAALTRDPQTGALSEGASPAGCVEFAGLDDLGCTAFATRWGGESPYAVAAPTDDGLLLAAIEQPKESETAVEVTRSPAGGALAVTDVRGCVVGGCRPLRGTNSRDGLPKAGPLAASADGRSIYLAGEHGIAQIRLP